MQEDSHNSLREYILTILPEGGITDWYKVGVQEDNHDSLRECILTILPESGITNWC